MGKIRVKTVGIEEEEKKQQAEAKKRADAKRAKEEGSTNTTENGEEASSDTPKPTVQKNVSKGKKVKSKKQIAVEKLIDKNKQYKLKDALELLPQIKLSSFDESVELHINTNEGPVSGNVTLPHGTGKEVRVAIADEAIIAEIEKGQINFDILIAEPMMMAKLAKVAKVLGPRGLMPNPKNGTVTQKTEEAANKFKAGQVNFKTESKFPLLHMTVGKVSFGSDKLSENIKSAISAVQKKNVKSVTLKSTMSPGLRLETANL